MEDDLIRTEYKDKLPKGLSYPLGAKEISRALSSVPQYGGLALSFVRSPTIAKSEFQDAITRGLEHVVVRANYRHLYPGISGCHSFEEMGYYDEHWSLTVYPVLREKRHIAHELLCSNGLPRVREWLYTPRPDTWRDGLHFLAVTFNESDETIHIHE